MSKGTRPVIIYFRALRMGLILAYTFVLVRLFPLRSYYGRYLEGNGSRPAGTMQPSADQFRLAKRMVRLVPWKVSCLMESMAFHIYFRRYGILVPVTLGVNPEEGMKAHAWNFDRPGREFAIINK